MSDKREMICSNCGENIAIGKFCPKCGGAIKITPKQVFKIQKQRLDEISKRLVNFETTILKTLAPEYHQKFFEIKSRIDTLIKKINLDSKRMKQKDKDLEKPSTICLRCGQEVAFTKFCQNCGNFLGESELEVNEEYGQNLIRTQNYVIAFKRSLEKILAAEALTDLTFIFNTLRQLILHFTKKDGQQEETEVIDVKKEKIAKGWEEVYSSSGVLVRKKPKAVIAKKQFETVPTKIPAKTPSQLPTRTKKSETKIEPKKSTMYSKLERNLLDYWFFYLATIIFSVGISITLYFVSVELESEVWQLVIIYSIGAVIIGFGQGLALITKRREKKKLAKEESKEISDKEKKHQSKELMTYTPQMKNVILFIGFIVIFVGGFIGILSYESLGVSKGVFIGLSLGLSVVLMVISILNKSEFLALNSILQAIIFTVVDLLWAQYPPILNNVLTLIVYLLIIVGATCVSIFFKKWTVSAVAMAIMLCIPRVYTQIGLEFLVLILIPIMIILSIQFGSEKTPMQIKRSLVVLSFLLPTISLFVISLISYFNPVVEPAWATYQPYQSLIIGVVFIGISYYYQFIQEKHLDIKSSNEIIWFAGQVLTGLISFLTVGLYRDTLITSLFFTIFFVFGILSTIKLFREKLSVQNIFTSFVIAETLAILVIVLVDVDTTAESILVFLLGISFVIIAIVSLFIPHLLHQQPVLFRVWFILSTINLILLGLIGIISPWLIFASIILHLCCSIIAAFPIIIPKITLWREFSMISLILNGITVVVLLLTHNLDFFDYIPLIIFIFFFIASISGFINWKETEVVLNE
ncbi:MAG: zinc ribbon domain-containing protein [Candidatus Heimdallarchaeota archaeon]